MNVSHKTRKTVADAVKATGEVIAMVSPFGAPPDLQGDVIDPNAYDADIEYWNRSPNLLPVLISHEWVDESANIGHVTRLEPVPGYGLVAHMKLDLTNERARYVHKLMSERRMVEFSIGYDTLGDEERLADGSTLLKRLHLLEVSVVFKGAASFREEPYGRTELLMVKNGANTATAPKPPPDPEILEYEERLAELLGPARPKAASAGQIDELILEVRQELIQESLDRAEQAAWEERMDINAVLDPVPVVVDARMRPDR